MADQYTMTDPTRQYPRPEFPVQEQQPPGKTGAMRPRPDHGEDTYRGANRLPGRRALVTGGDSGIGRAVAIAYAREGADVVITYLPEERDDADETVRFVEKAGRRALAIAVDLTQRDDCDELVERTVQELGGLDILVVNAAYQMSQEGLANITPEQLERTYRTNVFAMFWLCQAALGHLKPGATIITTSSIQAYEPSPSLLDYASTKAAIGNFTKGLSNELGPKGIRVNSVAPGPIWTPLIPSTMPDDKPTRFGENTTLGRAGQPAELAPAYVFLASQESSYITGEVIGVTGGRLLP